MFDVLAVKEHAEVPFAIAEAIIDKDTPDGEAEAGEEDSAHVKETLGGGAGLIGQDGGKGNTGLVVDGDVQVLMASAAGLAGAISVDAMSRLDDGGQAFDTLLAETPYPLPPPSSHTTNRFVGSSDCPSLWILIVLRCSSARRRELLELQHLGGPIYL